MAIDKTQQYELMAAIRAYAAEISSEASHDTRPSTALISYKDKVQRMYELSRLLNTKS